MKKQTLLLVLTLLLSLLCVQHAAAIIYLSEDFENIPADAKIPQGWDNMLTTDMHAAPGDVWGKSLSGYKGFGLKFNSYNVPFGSYNVVYSPAITLPQAADAQVDFMFKNPMGGDCYLCVLDSNEKLDTISENLFAIPYWTKYSFLLSKYAGQTIRLAWYSVSNYADGDAYHYLDNVLVQDRPICARPINLNVSGLTQTSATLCWELDLAETNPSAYNVLVKQLDGTEVINKHFEETGFSTLLSGLQAGTSYNVVLKGDCSSFNKGDSETSDVFSFSTLLDPISLPYELSFVNNILPIGIVCSGDVIISNQLYYGNSGFSLKMKSSKEKSAIIVFPQMAHPSNDVELLAMVRTIDKNVKFTIGLMSDPSDPSSFVSIADKEISNNHSWVDFRLNTSCLNETLSNRSLAILVPNGMDKSVYFDNIIIRKKPSCTRPENVMIGSVDSTSASIVYDGNLNALGRCVEIDDGNNISYNTISSYPAVLSGLKNNSYYTIRVRDICSVGDTSDWSLPISFNTTCCASPALGFFEGFENVVNVVPECWTQRQIVKGSGNLDYGDRAWVTSDYRKYSGLKSMKLQNSSSGTHTLLISSPIYVDQAGKYDFSLQFYRNGDSPIGEGIGVWISNTPDTVNAHKYEFINANYRNEPVAESVGYAKYEYNINKEGVIYIILDGVSQYSTSLYVDDINVYLAPSCRKLPRNCVKIQDPTKSTVRFTWPKSENNTASYLLSYALKTYGKSIVSKTEVVNDNYLDVSGLQSMSHYVVNGNVSVVCGVGDTSEVVPFNVDFNTQSDVLNVPFLQTFNDEYFPPVGWSVDDQTMLYRTESSGSGTGAVALYRSKKDTVLFISPQINIPKGNYDLNYRLYRRFRESESDTIEGFKFYVNTNPTLDGAKLLQRIYSNKDYGLIKEKDEGFYDYEVPLDDVFGLQYIIIEGYTAGNSTNYLEDVGVSLAPSCRKIRNFSLDSVLSTSVVFDVFDSCSWEIEYGPSKFIIGTGEKRIFNNTTHGKLSGLNPATKYDFYLRRVCGAQERSVLTYDYPLCATTECLPFEISNTQKYFEGFESYSDYDVIKGCMMQSSFDGSVKQKTATVLYREIAAYEGNVYARHGSGLNAWNFVSMKLKAGVNYEISGFFIQDKFAKNKNMKVSLGYALEPMYNSCNVLTEEYVPAAQWTKVFTFFNVPTDGVYYVGWKIEQSSYPAWMSGMDNLMVREVACIPPTVNVVSALSSDTAKIEWVSNASQWELLVTDADTAISHNVVFRDTLSESYCVLRNLESNKDYYYYLRSICEGEFSSWSKVASFRTNCSNYGVPYNVNFEDVDSAIIAMRCWSLHGSNAYVERSSSYGYKSNASLEISNATIAFPSMAVNSLKNCYVNGWLRSTKDSLAVSIGVMLNPNDLSTFEPLSTVMIPSREKWFEFTSFFKELSLPDYTSFENAKYVAFQVSDPYAIIYLDDLCIDAIPSCPKPTEPNISDVTSHSFKLSWKQNGFETQWRASIYSEGVFVTDTILTQNPAVIDNLEAITEYNVFLQSICSETDTSKILDCGIVVTDCGIFQVPYTLKAPKSSSVKLPSCWEIGPSNTSSMDYWHWYKRDGEWALYTCPYNYGGYSQVKYKTIVHSCVFDLSGIYAPTLKLDIKNIDADTSYIMIRKESDLTYDTLGYFNSQNGRDTLEYNLSSFIGQKIVVAIEGRTSSSFNGGTYIYSMCVDGERSCLRPQSFEVVAVHADNIDILIHDSVVVHDKWQVACVPFGAKPTTGINVNKSHKITGLNASTKYDIYVRTVCAEGDYSLWSGPVSVSTVCPSVNVPYNQSFEYGVDLDEMCLMSVGKSYSGSALDAYITDRSFEPKYVNHGEKSLLMISDYKDDYYFALPQFVDSLSTLSLSFDYRNETEGPSNGHIVVGYVKSLANVAGTFTPVYRCPLSKAFREVIIDFDTVLSVGENGTIAFMYDGSSSYYMAAIDNIRVVPLGACPRVKGVDLLDADFNSLTLRVNGKNINHVQVAYDVMNVSPEQCANIVEFNNDTIILKDLNVGSTYNIYLRTICENGDTSVWSVPSSFSTRCEDFILSDTVDYYEGFENLSSMLVKFPSCMSIISNDVAGGKTLPQVSRGSAISGEYGLHMNGNIMLVLPTFNYNSDNLILSLTSKGSNFSIGVTDVLVSDSVVEVATLYNALFNPKTHLVELFDANVYGKYIVIYSNVSSDQWMIDDISVKVKPQCYIPRKVKVEQLGDTFADISWDSGEKFLAFEYKLLDFNNLPIDTIFGNLGSNNVKLSGLACEGKYSISVRSICGVGDTTEWSSPVLFTTRKKLAEVPYSTSFENTTENSNWIFENGAYNDKFVIGSDRRAILKGGNALYLSKSVNYEYEGAYYMFNPSDESGVYNKEVMFVYRTFNLEEGQYNISYTWKGEGVADNDGVNAYNYGRIFVMPASHNIRNAGISFESKYDMVSDRLFNQSNWLTSNSMFFIDKPGVYNLVVAWYQEQSAGLSAPLAIDSILVEKSNCAAVKSIDLLNVTSDSATIQTVNINSSGELQFYLTAYDSLIVDTTTIGSGVNVFGLSNLSSNTLYKISARYLCESGISSAWKSRYFNTRCIPDTIREGLPYSDSFEEYNSGYLGDCWSDFSNFGKGVFMLNTEKAGYNRAPYNGNNYLTLEHGNNNSLFRDFYLEKGKTYEISIWGVADGIHENCSFALVSRINGVDSILMSSDLTNVYSKLMAKFIPTESGVYNLGINVSLNDIAWFASVDLFEIKVEELPLPTGINVIDITTNSAVVVWEKCVDSCRVEVLNGTTIIFDTILPPSDNTCIVRGLSPNMLYNVRLRTECNVKKSSWSPFVVFNTPCAVHTLPYIQDFSGYSIGSMVSCWDNETRTSSTKSERWKIGVSGSNNVLRLASSHAFGLNSVMTNQFYVDDVNKYVLSFDYVINSPFDSLQVYLSTDGGITLNDTILLTRPNTAQSSVTYALEKYAGDTIVIVFSSFASYESTPYYIDVDNFSISCVDEVIISDTICYGTTYLSHGFNIPAGQLVESGLHKFSRYDISTNPNTCNIMTYLNLYVRPNNSQLLYDTICEGDVYVSEAFPNGLSLGGKYIKTMTGVNGCDSLITLFLTVANPRYDYSYSICDGDTYNFNGMLLTDNGVYRDTIIRTGKCDSIVTLNLKVLPTKFHTDKTVCDGEEYIWLDTVVATSGVYVRRYKNHIGCDSVHTLNFTVLPSEVSIDSTICHGQLVKLGTNVYSESGDYSVLFENSLGCDSVVNLHLTVLEPDTIDVADQVCEGYKYSGYGYVDVSLTSDTILQNVQKDADGCEMVQRLYIDFIPTITVDTMVSISDGETYLFCGNSLSKSGTYDCTLRSESTGCDSVVHLTLVVTTGVDNVYTLPLVIAPNPVDRGREVVIYQELTSEEQEGVRVEVLDALGRMIQHFVPDSYPIKVSVFDVSGVYTIRIVTGTDKVYQGKVLVK